MLRLVPYYGSSVKKTYDNIDSVFDDFFRTGLSRVKGDSFKIDVEKGDKEYIVTAELPGVDKNNINVEVENNILTISVSKDEEKEEKNEEKNYLHRERSSFSAVRQISLEDVDDAKISAGLENGILTVKLPIREEVSNKKSISID